MGQHARLCTVLIRCFSPRICIRGPRWGCKSHNMYSGWAMQSSGATTHSNFKLQHTISFWLTK